MTGSAFPKANGYESLHTTVMSPGGRWVEVQIRSQRMDEIAEMGLAAHYRYKDDDAHAGALDAMLTKIRDILGDPGNSAIDFVNDFKLNLFSDEIVVFTPKGEMRNLPAGATALDFAFDIHSHVGRQCIGAKVNHKLVPLSHKLRNGDQIEIITSKKQQPKEDWLTYVVTARARHKIKQALREQKRKLAVVGREAAQRKLRGWGAKVDDRNVAALVEHFRATSSTDLFYRIARGRVDLDTLGTPAVKAGRLNLPPRPVAREEERALEEVVAEIRGQSSGALVHRRRPAQDRLSPEPLLQPHPRRRCVRLHHRGRGHQDPPRELPQRRAAHEQLRLPHREGAVEGQGQRGVPRGPAVLRHRRGRPGEQDHHHHQP